MSIEDAGPGSPQRGAWTVNAPFPGTLFPGSLYQPMTPEQAEKQQRELAERMNIAFKGIKLFPQAALAINALTLTRDLILHLLPESRQRARIVRSLTDAMEDVRELPA